jgi:hypothetical protein
MDGTALRETRQTQTDEDHHLQGEGRGFEPGVDVLVRCIVDRRPATVLEDDNGVVIGLDAADGYWS